MVIAICIIVWILCDIAESNARERKYYERQAERRHREMIDSQPEQKHRTRTIVREIIDEQGRVVRETITEEIWRNFGEVEIGGSIIP